MVFHFYALIFFIKLVLWCWITVVLFNQVTWLWCFKICYQINYTLLYWGFLCPCSYVNFIYFSPVWCLIYFFCFCSVYCRKHFPFFNDWPLASEQIWTLRCTNCRFKSGTREEGKIFRLQLLWPMVAASLLWFHFLPHIPVSVVLRSYQRTHHSSCHCWVAPNSGLQ